jgi:CBS domain-containing protein
MTVARVFNTSDFTFLRDTDTLEVAARTLLRIQHRVSNLPVVDAGGKLVGTLSVDRLVAALLPKAATVSSGLLDLGFVHDTLEHLREKMREVGGEPVARHMDREPPVLRLDTPLMEALLLIYRGENDLPVVDPESGSLLGIASALDILRAVFDEEPR